MFYRNYKTKTFANISIEEDTSTTYCFSKYHTFTESENGTLRTNSFHVTVSNNELKSGLQWLVYFLPGSVIRTRAFPHQVMSTGRHSFKSLPSSS